MSSNDTRSTFHQAKPEAFTEKLLTALNHGALCLMISIGHRTRLFDAMVRACATRSRPASGCWTSAAAAGWS